MEYPEFSTVKKFFNTLTILVFKPTSSILDCIKYGCQNLEQLKVVLLHLISQSLKSVSFSKTKTFGISRLEICLLRHCLLFESPEIIFAALRTCRYLLISDSILKHMINSSIPEFVVTIIERVPDSSNELIRSAALRFIRRWCLISSYGCSDSQLPYTFVCCLTELSRHENIPKALIYYMPAIVDDRDSPSILRFRLACLKTLRDLCLTHLEMVYLAGGTAALIDSLFTPDFLKIDPNYTFSISSVIAVCLNKKLNSDQGDYLSINKLTKDQLNLLNYPIVELNQIWEKELSYFCDGLLQLLHSPIDNGYKIITSLDLYKSTLSTSDFSTNPTNYPQYSSSLHTSNFMSWLCGSNALLSICSNISGLLTFARHPFGLRSLIEQMAQSLSDQASLFIIRFFHALISISLGLRGRVITEQDALTIKQRFLDKAQSRELFFNPAIYNKELPSDTTKDVEMDASINNTFIFASNSHPASFNCLPKSNNLSDTFTQYQNSFFQKHSDFRLNENFRQENNNFSFLNQKIRESDLQYSFALLVFRILFSYNFHTALSSVFIYSRHPNRNTQALDSTKKQLADESQLLFSYFIYLTSILLPSHSDSLFSQVCLFLQKSQDSTTAQLRSNLHSILHSLSKRLTLSSPREIYSSDILTPPIDPRQHNLPIAKQLIKVNLKDSTESYFPIDIFHLNHELSHLNSLMDARSIKKKSRFLQISGITFSAFPPTTSSYYPLSNDLKFLIEKTKVFQRRDFRKWDWITISKLVEGPLWVCLSYIEPTSLESRFLRRLLQVFLPSSKQFSSLSWEANNLIFLRVGVMLILLLLNKEDQGRAEGLYFGSKNSLLLELVESLDKNFIGFETTKESYSHKMPPPMAVSEKLTAFNSFVSPTTIKNELVYTQTHNQVPFCISSLKDSKVPPPLTQQTMYSVNKAQTVESPSLTSNFIEHKDTKTSQDYNLSSFKRVNSWYPLISLKKTVGVKASTPIFSVLNNEIDNSSIKLGSPFNSISNHNFPISSHLLYDAHNSNYSINSLKDTKHLQSNLDNNLQTSSSSYEINNIAYDLSQIEYDYKLNTFSSQNILSTMSREYSTLIGTFFSMEIGQEILESSGFFIRLKQLVENPSMDYLTTLFIPFLDIYTQSGLDLYQHYILKGSKELKVVSLIHLPNLLRSKIVDLSSEDLKAFLNNKTSHDTYIFSGQSSEFDINPRPRVFSEILSTHRDQNIEVDFSNAILNKSISTQNLTLDCGKVRKNNKGKSGTAMLVNDKSFIQTYTSHKISPKLIDALQFTTTSTNVDAQHLLGYKNNKDTQTHSHLSNLKDAHQLFRFQSPVGTVDSPQIHTLMRKVNSAPDFLNLANFMNWTSHSQATLSTTTKFNDKSSNYFVREVTKLILELVSNPACPQTISEKALNIIDSQSDILDLTLIDEILLSEFNTLVQSGCLRTISLPLLLQFDSGVSILKQNSSLDETFYAYIRACHPSFEKFSALEQSFFNSNSYFYIDTINKLLSHSNLNDCLPDDLIPHTNDLKSSVYFPALLEPHISHLNFPQKINSYFPRIDNNEFSYKMPPNFNLRSSEIPKIYKQTLNESPKSDFSSKELPSWMHHLPIQIYMQLINRPELIDTTHPFNFLLNEKGQEFLLDTTINQRPDDQFISSLDLKIENFSQLNNFISSPINHSEFHQILCYQSNSHNIIIGYISRDQSYLPDIPMESQSAIDKRKIISSFFNLNSLPSQLAITSRAPKNFKMNQIKQPIDKSFKIKITITIGDKFLNSKGQLGSRDHAFWINIECWSALEDFKKFLTSKGDEIGKETAFQIPNDPKCHSSYYYMVLEAGFCRLLFIGEISIVAPSCAYNPIVIESNIYIALAETCLKVVPSEPVSISPPESLLTNLGKTQTGCTFLENSKLLVFLDNILKNNENQQAIETRSALWSAGQIMMHENGFNLLEKHGILKSVIDTTFQCSLPAVRGTGLYVLSCVTMTPQIFKLLESYNWDLLLRGPTLSKFSQFLSGSRNITKDDKIIEKPVSTTKESHKIKVMGSDTSTNAGIDTTNILLIQRMTDLVWNPESMVDKHIELFEKAQFWSESRSQAVKTANHTYSPSEIDLNCTNSSFRIKMKQSNILEASNILYSPSGSPTNSLYTLHESIQLDSSDLEYYSGNYGIGVAGQDYEVIQKPLSESSDDNCNFFRLLSPQKNLSTLPGEFHNLVHAKNTIRENIDSKNSSLFSQFNLRTNISKVKSSYSKEKNNENFFSKIGGILQTRPQNLTDLNKTHDYNAVSHETFKSMHQFPTIGLPNTKHRHTRDLPIPPQSYSNTPLRLSFSKNHKSLLEKIAGILNPAESKQQNLIQSLCDQKNSEPELFLSIELWYRIRLLTQIYNLPLSMRRFLSKLFDTTFDNPESLVFLDTLQHSTNFIF